MQTILQLKFAYRSCFDDVLVVSAVFATLQSICEMTQYGISADGDPLGFGNPSTEPCFSCHMV